MIETGPFIPAEHYEDVCDWWRETDWAPVPVHVLPPTGVMVLSNGAPACAGWLYKTDAPMGHMEWIIANPKVRRTARSMALDALISALLGHAKQANIKLIFTSTMHPQLIARYEKHGFMKTDTGMTNLFWGV